MEELYKRQAKLGLSIPDSVAIIGVGGVGSWVAMFFAMVGVKKIVMIDFDTIEEHNLNRTPFREHDIGHQKLSAMTDIIIEKRPDISVMSYHGHVERLEQVKKDEINSCTEIIDCRDMSGDMGIDLNKSSRIKGGYDGLSVTMHINDSHKKVWGEEGRVTYSDNPSYLCPPVMIAINIVDYICNPKNHITEEKIRTFDMSELFNESFIQKG